LIIAGAGWPALAADKPGKQVYAQWCIHCHAAGEDYPGTWKLALRLGKDKAVLAERRDLNAEYIKYVVRHGLGGMPLFRGVEISNSELEALTQYLVRP
jgi:mono/diheme cytochrome c family protein